MSDRIESKHWEDIKEGEALPALHFPITPKTMVLAVCGTRDLMPYHHNPEYSKSLGNRDMFINTMFEQALFGRYVTDWCGPESDFRETMLQMVVQIVPGDVAVIEGSVTKKYREGEDYLALITMTASNELGVGARATATIAMPSREGGAVKPKLELSKPSIEVDPQIPDFAKEWLGQLSPKAKGAYPISEVQIMYWCDMVEDANPLYADGDYARASRHGGVIAPPMGLITYMMGRGSQGGVDPAYPDVDCPERKAWPPRKPSKKSPVMNMTPPGATDTIATRSIQTYGKPLRPGDRVSSTTEVINCSPLKRTKIGLGYFQTQLNTYYNQHDEIIGTNVFELLRYGVPEESE
jgi:acyl dehydratase